MYSKSKTDLCKVMIIYQQYKFSSFCQAYLKIFNILPYIGQYVTPVEGKIKAGKSAILIVNCNIR